MKIYNSNEIKNFITDIENNKEKPLILEGKERSYEKLTDREFEILIYCIFKRNIVGSNKVYQSIDLMQGVGEKGRDCVLYSNGQPKGIIQCKHTEKNTRMDKPNALKEIIKFALNCIKDNTIVPSDGQIDYYFVHSFAFAQPAQTMLNNFYSEVTKDKSYLKEITEKIISKYKSLSDLKYESIQEELLEILKRLNIKKYEMQDINQLIVNENDILSIFFQVQKVIVKNPSLPRQYENIEMSDAQIDEFKNKNFIYKLKRIKLSREYRIEAIKDYWSAIKTIDLLSDIEIFDESIIELYEDDLYRKYTNYYGTYCEDIEEDYDEKEIRKLSRKFYRKVVNQDAKKIINIDDNRPFFQNGIYQNMADTDRIPTWMLKFINEEE